MPHAHKRSEALGEPPARIGSYEVLTRLALGGMAELLLARRVGIEGFQKLVVLKRILPQYAAQPDFVEMFLHEARLAAALEHPNIVQVFDIGKADGDYYFAMAYLHGKDVLTVLRELDRRDRTLATAHAIAIASGIAAGLHHAHEQLGFDGKPLQIVHRDVSPSNAIVTYDGAVKLVDFGIAKATAQASHTRVGVRKGKAAYMSPEQCRGEPLDRRTDIWSLGVVLHEMLTMRRLFRADNDLAMMHQLTTVDPPPPSRIVPEIPPRLDAIVMQCLQRDRRARYATADALQQDLDACAHELGMRASAHGLAELLRELFGTPPLPWAPHSPTSGGPVTASVDGPLDDDSDASPVSDVTRDLADTPPPVVDTRVGASNTTLYASPEPAPSLAAPAAMGPPSTIATAPGTPAAPGDAPTRAEPSSPSTVDSRVAPASPAPRGRLALSLTGVLVGAAAVLAWAAWPRSEPPGDANPTAGSLPSAAPTPSATAAIPKTPPPDPVPATEDRDALERRTAPEPTEPAALAEPGPSTTPKATRARTTRPTTKGTKRPPPVDDAPATKAASDAPPSTRLDDELRPFRK